ncbi:MAG: hypothetical protein HOP11_08675 [Saprospiraceae bacterium]|nr:hypothetical protein [Saprospiraceae bacterium]
MRKIIILDTIIIECHIFPSIECLSLFAHNQVQIEAHENYQKRSFRNRYFIKDRDGLQSLSIPLLKGKNQQQHIQNVAISYDHPWVKQHIQTLQTVYGKAPYFLYYFEEIKQMLEAKTSSLFELNLNTTKFLLHKIGLKKDLELTSTFCKNYESAILDCRNKFDINSANQVELVESRSFSNVKINPLMSGLDLLFNFGPESILLLNELR